MNISSILGLRARLFLVVLAALCPVLALLLYDLHRERVEATASAQGQVLRGASLIAGDQRQLVDGAERLLTTLAAATPAIGEEPETCSRLMRQVLQKSPPYLNLGAASADGQVFCSALPLRGPVNIADRAYFRRAVETRAFAVGDYQIGRITGRASVNFAYPLLTEQGELRGVLIAALDVAAVGAAIDTGRLPLGTSVVVMDDNATTLASYPGTVAAVGQPVPDNPLLDAFKRPLVQSTFAGKDPQGAERVYALESVRHPVGSGPAGDVNVGISIPKGAILAGVDEAARRNLIGLTLTAALALGAAWFAGELFVRRRLNVLASATERVAAGEQGVRSGLAHEPTEFGRVAQAFDTMSERLEEKQREAGTALVAMRTSEARYRELVDSIPEVIYEVDTTQDKMYPKVVFASAQTTPIIGYTPQEFMRNPALWFEIMHPEDVAEVRESTRQVYETKRGASRTYRLKHAKTGEYRHIEDTIVPRLDYRGEVVGLFGVGRDITERRSSEQTVQRQAAILDRTNDFVAIADTQHHVLFVNRAGRRMLGVGGEESLESVTIEGSHPPGAREVVLREGIPAALRNGIWSGETVLLSRQGRHIPVSQVIMAHKGPDGSVEFLSTIARDISERKQAEQRTKEEAAHAQAMARISGALNAQLDQRAVLETVCEETAQALNVPLALAYLRDEKSGQYEVVCYHGVPDEASSLLEPLPASTYDAILENGRSLLLVKDVQAIPGLVTAELHRALDVRSGLGSVLVRGGKVLGSLNVATRRETRIFTSEEQALLTAIAAQTAQALANAQQFDETERRRRELESVAKVGAALREAGDRAEMLRMVLAETTELLCGNGAAITLLDSSGGELVTELATGTLEGFTGDRMKPSEGLTGQVLSSLITFSTSDAKREPEFHRPELVPGNGQALAMVGAPLVAFKEALGVLWLARQRSFDRDEASVVTAIADIAANAIRRVTLHETTQRQLRWTAAMRAVDAAVSGSMDLHLTLNVVLQQVASQLGADAAAVLLLDQPTQSLVYAAALGFRSGAIEESKVRLGEGAAGRVAVQRRVVSIPDLEAPGESLQGLELLAAEGFKSYHAAPLVAKGQIRGVLEVFNRTPTKLNKEQVAFLEGLAAQTAIAVDNAVLFEGLQRSNTDLALAYDSTLEGWANMLELRDYETAGHSRRVAEMSLRLARAIGFGEAELAQLRRGVLLHDIGKMAIPDAILHKPGPLTEEEWDVVRRHPSHAFNVLSGVVFLRPALDIPYCHHERWDGTGYPQGLKGEQIPLGARVFSVVDVWDALKHERPYKEVWPEERVREHILSQSGTHFDPKVVEAFVRIAWPESGSLPGGLRPDQREVHHLTHNAGTTAATAMRPDERRGASPT